MKKRILSMFHCIIFTAAFTLTCFSGCQSSGNEDCYTILQWLGKVEETFNLLYYSEQESLIKSVNTADEGFEIIQIAADWGIISPDDDLKFDDKLTKELAADTLVRAMNCASPATISITDSNNVKSLYLENVMSSVNEGIFTLEDGKFDPKKQLSISEADDAMLTAYYRWINFSYGESFDKSIIKENVINLGGVTSENSNTVQAEYSVEYTGNRTFFDENGGYTDNTEKVITFPADQVPLGLTTDTVLAMPADDVVPMNYAVVVTNVKTNDDGSVTVSTRNAELQDVYEEINIQQSEILDFSEAVFYGPDGQRVIFDDYESPADMAIASDNVQVEPLGLYRPGGNETVNTDDTKLSTNIKLGDGFSMTISCPISSNGGGIGLKIKGEAKSNGEKMSAEIGFDESIKVENRVNAHWEWFNLKVDELKLSMTDTKTETFGFSCSAVENFGKTDNTVDDHNNSGDFDIGDWATEGHMLRKLYNDTKTVGQSFKDLAAQAKSATNKKILDIVFPSTNLHFVIRAELTVEGSLKLTLTQSNMAGIELVQGKLRPIQEKSNSQKLDLSAKIELTFRAAFEFQLIGINVADVGCKAGIGAKVNSIVYSYDKASNTLLEVCGIEGGAITPGTSATASDDVQVAETGLKIQTDETRTDRICQEIKVYPIVTVFGCSSSRVAGKLFGSIELEILGENTPLLMIHYEINENGVGIVSECSVTANENYGIKTGDKLELNMNEYAIGVGGDADTGLAVTTVPKNTSIKDITIISDNTDVLEVENLLHKATLETTPAYKPKLKIESSAMSYFLPKDSDTDIKLSSTQELGTWKQFGTWFYQDMSEGAKPQFALTGKKNGRANVIISAGGESVTIPVQVGTGEEAVVSSGALIGSQGTFTLAPGESVQAAFDFIPEEKTIADISFISADNSVATVSSGGFITAIGTGDTVITATLQGEEKEFTTTFTVHVVV